MAGPAWLTDGSPLPDPHGKGDLAVKFVRKLRLHEGKLAGKTFPLQPWQERIIRRVYGDTRPDGLRRVRTVFLLLPRGNGKTTLGAALGLLHLLGPAKEAGGQVICAAADREQASIAYKAALRMVEQDRYLQGLTYPKASVKTLEHPKSGSVFKAISHEAYTKHGLSVSFLLSDEIHAWPNRDLWEVLRTSMGKREEPLTFVITTAGSGVHSIAFELYAYARRVAYGEVEDESFLPILFEPQPGADWLDESVWFDVNPALAAGFRSLEEMRTTARQAVEVPAQRVAFQQLYLNMWQDGAPDPAFDLAIWDEGEDDDLRIDDFEHLPCWLAVDLSKTTDLTAVVACFATDDGRFALFPFFFVPEDGIERRVQRDHVPYREWCDAGHLSATPGSVVDLATVEDCIRELAGRFDVREILFDPWQARPMVTRLTDDGLPAIEMRQTFAGMSGPTKEFERALLSRRIIHDGNPVLRWNVGNAVLMEDSAGNLRPNKNKSTDRIDGAVASIMALGRAAIGETGQSIYNDLTARPHGFLVI